VTWIKTDLRPNTNYAKYYLEVLHCSFQKIAQNIQNADLSNSLSSFQVKWGSRIA